MARYVRTHTSDTVDNGGPAVGLSVTGNDYPGDLITAAVDFLGYDSMVLLSQGPLSNADGTLVGWQATVRNDGTSSHPFNIITVSE